MSEPTVLVTNDDGIDAPGIRALAAALRPVADVQVVAPASNQSWAGRDMTWHAGPTGIQEHDLGYAVEGTPADAVTVALSVLDVAADAVVAGVNDGMNLSAHILERSGTVGAAFEAAHFGLPAVAVSTADHTDPEPPHPDPEAFTLAAGAGAFVLDRALDSGVFERADFLNVNAPAFAEDPEVHLTRPDPVYDPEPERVEDGEVELRDGGWQRFLEGDPGQPETDRHAVTHGHVSVTPMRLPERVETSLELGGFDPGEWR
ncbi:5'/3'-nucleotidase SurE [Halorarius halobius]|uniref:5'/3'-nucleotidase SurE n=1 Tax=Halorarius halobius TaxID=2962671 RepID=UPI0020CE3685|nr:5'/3'-nucleotidase SurE [Halorarius halobius]